MQTTPRPARVSLDELSDSLKDSYERWVAYAKFDDPSGEGSAKAASAKRERQAAAAELLAGGYRVLGSGRIVRVEV